MRVKAGEPWYREARAALEAEQAGAFSRDDELGELIFRELPFYFAHHGADEAAYVQTLRGELPNADALKLFNQEIFTSFDVRPLLPRITAHTLVITGEADFIAGPRCAAEIAEGLFLCRVALLPAAGHFIFIETPAGFRSEVLTFLGDA